MGTIPDAKRKMSAEVGGTLGGASGSGKGGIGDGSMGGLDIVAALRAAVRDEGIATKDDLAEVCVSVDRHTEDIDKLRQSVEKGGEETRDLRKEVDELRARVDHLRDRDTGDGVGSRTPRSSTTSTTARTEAQNSRFQPARILVRGWAPFGCAPTSKITADEARTLASQLLSSLPDLERKNLTVEMPFALNWQISFRMHRPDLHVAQRMVPCMRDFATTHSITVRSLPVCISLEQSEARRVQWKIYQEALQEITTAGFDQTKVLECRKSMDIYNRSTCESLGKWIAGTWMWVDAACARLGWERRAGGDVDDDDVNAQRR